MEPCDICNRPSETPRCEWCSEWAKLDAENCRLRALVEEYEAHRCGS